MDIAYHRSALRAGGSIVLWLLGAIALLLALFSVAITVATGSYLGNVAFYGFIALGLVLFGIGLWRRNDPRPARLTGRVLTITGSLSIVAALVSGSVLGTGDSKPIFFASQRYDVGGGLGSAAAPGTDGWESTRETTEFQETVNFGRDVGRGETAEDNETLRAYLSLTRAPGNALPSAELIAQALDTEKRANTTPRISNLRFATSPSLSGLTCIRYDAIADDTGVAKFPGTVFTLTSHGLMCTDASATNLVSLAWSHRYLEGTLPKVEESSAEPFLASLKISERTSPDRSPFPSARATGTVLFRDNFKDTTGRWRAGESELAKTGYLASGGFGIEIRRNAHAHASTPAVPTARDVEVEAEYSVRSTAAGFYGPTCRLDDAFGTFYVFGVASDGRYGIQRNVAGKLTPLAWSAGTVRAGLAAPTTVRIVAQCYGDGPVALVMTVNGTTLLRFQDTDGAIKSGGRASFLANSEAAGPATILQSFTVRELAP